MGMVPHADNDSVHPQERLFENSDRPPAPARTNEGPPPPLSERMRPRTWDEVVGQEHLTADGAPLRRLHASGRLTSTILWGPPGSGKTTLASLLVEMHGYAAERFSAVLSGVKDVRAVVERARRRWGTSGVRTVLFVDEIHRFNKAQQDAFLPHLEKGLIVLLGATTENPSFSIIPPLLSRCAVHVVRPLDDEGLRTLARRALADQERGIGAMRVELPEASLEVLLRFADLDARRFFNALEKLAQATPPGEDGTRRPDAAWTAQVCERSSGSSLGTEEHYDLISAMIKSIRGSDPHAALYWLARLLESGEDPRFVARRLVILAAEDVGLADPGALHHANAAAHAVEFIGMPEGRLPLAQAALYLAMAPKSNSVYQSYDRAAQAARDFGALAVPMRIRNAPTRLMERIGHGKGYSYPHDAPGNWVPESYLPEGLPASMARPYRAGTQGREPEIVRGHARRTRNFYELAADDPRLEARQAPPGGED